MSKATSGIRSRALLEILCYIAEGLRLNRAKLEVEDKGREVGKEQGLINGYKELLAMIMGVFHITQPVFDDLYENGSEHDSVPEMDDDVLDDMIASRDNLVVMDEWKIVLDRIKVKEDYEKQCLWLEADTTRELDLAHGLRDGMNCFRPFFDLLDSEKEVRRKKEEKRRQKESLFGGDAGKK